MEPKLTPTRNLKKGQKVILLANREKPNIAFIKAIYPEPIQ